MKINLIIMKRRNLSGIYIFEKFDTDEKKQAICFEDCTKETQDKWLESLDTEFLKRTVKILAETLRDIGEQLDLMRKTE